MRCNILEKKPLEEKIQNKHIPSRAIFNLFNILQHPDKESEKKNILEKQHTK